MAAVDLIESLGAVITIRTSKSDDRNTTRAKSMTTTTADISQLHESPGDRRRAGSFRIHPKAIRARRNRRLLVVALLVLVATVGYLIYWYTHDRFWVRTDNAYVTGNLVPVAAQASGIITQVLAEETQFVNRGDLLVRLDEHQAYAALGRARGRLARRSGGLPRYSSIANNWRRVAVAHRSFGAR